MNNNKIQIQILRTNQKDEEIINDLSQSLMNVLMKLRISKLSFQQNKNISRLSRLTYFLLTSLSCLQTLGEEYTGLIRVEGTKKFLPSKPVHLLWLILETYGDSITIKILNKLKENVSKNDELLPDAKQFILTLITFLQNFSPHLVKLQKADFYFRGHYPDIPKRLTCINYKCIHPLYNEHKFSSFFKLLGILTLLNVTIDVYTKLYIWRSAKQNENEQLDSSYSGTSGPKCVLCLEERKNNCATQCGHVFCWKCIGNWTQVRKECPICREPIANSRNIPLQNYY